jgi:hypothetical protein
MKKRELTIIIVSILLFSCSNNSEDDLIIPDSIITTKTYTNSVKSIVDANCISCHAAIPVFGAPMSLITYAQVKEALLNRGLLDRISRANGAPGLMPTNSRLPQQTIDVVVQWNLDGLLE